MSDLRVGIAGIGVIAKDYLELFSQGRISGGRVCALSSRNVQTLHETAKRYGVAQSACYTDYGQMLAAGQVDAVIICTPHAQHPQMAVQALEQGLHVLIEKPLGASRGEAKEILSACAAHPQRACGVLYCQRMHPIYRRVKELVQAGTLGQLKRACWQITNLYRTDAYHHSAPWRGSWAGENGGVLMTQASHQLDLLLWFTGTPAWVHGFCETRGRAIEVENEAMIQMGFADGATGQFIASSHEFPGSNRLELSGDCGQIIVEDNARLTVRRLSEPEGSFAAHTEGMFGPIPFTEMVEIFPESDNRAQQAALIADFLSAAANGQTPVCSAQEAMQSLAVINAAYLSVWEKATQTLDFDDDTYAQAFAVRAKKD